MNRSPLLREAKAAASARNLLPSLEVRLPDLIGARAVPARALAGLRFGFIGAGSIGLSLVAHCSRFAPAEVIISDPKMLEPKSLLTHPAPPSAVGRSKARYAAQLCKSLSPHTRVRWIEGEVQELSLDALAEMDAVFMATDELGAEVESGQILRHLGRRLIQASVLGCNLTANIRVFSNAPEAPCPACAFGPTEWAQLNSETVFSCDGTGGTIARSQGPPTRSLSFLCSIAADLALVQFLRHQLNLGAPVADTNLEYCAYTHRSVSAPLIRNPDCPCDHTPLTRATVPRAIPESTLRELIDCSGLNSSAALEGITVGLDQLYWFESGRCACPQPHAVGRFASVRRRQIGRCARCHQPVWAQPFHTHAGLPLARGQALLDRPLRTLGVPRARWAVVRRHDHGVLLRPLHQNLQVQSP